MYEVEEGKEKKPYSPPPLVCSVNPLQICNIVYYGYGVSEPAKPNQTNNNALHSDSTQTQTLSEKEVLVLSQVKGHGQ